VVCNFNFLETRVKKRLKHVFNTQNLTGGVRVISVTCLLIITYCVYCTLR